MSYNVRNSSITIPKLITPRSAGQTVGIGGLAISPSSSNFSTTSSSSVPVTNLIVTLTTTGRPIHIMLKGEENSIYPSTFGTNGCIYVRLQILLGSLVIYTTQYGPAVNLSTGSFSIPCSCISTIAWPGAGTYTITVRIQADGSGNIAQLSYASLVAFEI